MSMEGFRQKYTDCKQRYLRIKGGGSGNSVELMLGYTRTKKQRPHDYVMSLRITNPEKIADHIQARWFDKGRYILYPFRTTYIEETLTSYKIEAKDSSSVEIIPDRKMVLLHLNYQKYDGSYHKLLFLIYDCASLIQDLTKFLKNGSNKQKSYDLEIVDTAEEHETLGRLIHVQKHKHWFRMKIAGGTTTLPTKQPVQTEDFKVAVIEPTDIGEVEPPKEALPIESGEIGKKEE